MTQTQINRETEHPDRAVDDLRLSSEPDEPRVVDFCRSTGSPFFAAVVTHGRLESPPVSDSRLALRACPSEVTLVGELDVSTAPILRACLERIDGNIVIDCSGLDGIDEQGLRSLVATAARSERTHAPLALVEAPWWLLRLLRISGLDVGRETPSNRALPR